jgi:hypothetical protein
LGQLIDHSISTLKEVDMTDDQIKQAVGPVDQDRCDNCPPERVCAWDCEQGRGVLEIMMGEALAEQARAMLPIDKEQTRQAPFDIYT